MTPTSRWGTCVWPIEVDQLYGCHLWQGKVEDVRGYRRAVVRIKGTWYRAYVLAWEAEHGPVPEGRELDHVCRRPLCVNPAHLELVTRSENERRKSWRRRAKITHCPQGHDLWRDGRRTPEGGKVCLVCSGLKAPPENRDGG